jgi:hypothetical protein
MIRSTSITAEPASIVLNGITLGCGTSAPSM